MLLSRSISQSLLACLAMAAMTACGGGTAIAQSATVGSTATIVTPITAAVTSPLAFGSITKGSSASISATSASAAAVTFSGDEGDNIVITIPPTLELATLSGTGAGMVVMIDRGALRTGTTSAQGSATPADASSGTVAIPLSADEEGNTVGSDGLGQAFVWIGGSITPGPTQQRGTYSGTFTISAAYSN